MKLVPLKSQNKMERFILTKGSCGLFVKMGVGKTAPTLTAIEKLMYEVPIVRRTLIFAPLRVARITWPDEIAKWDHARILSHTVLHGPKKDELIEQAHYSDITLLNYEGAQWAWNNKHLFPKYDMVVLDESTFIKNYKAHRSKLVGKITRFIPRRVLLTGSPAPNSIEDLWHQVFILDRGMRLGTTLKIFRDRYMYRDPYKDKFFLKKGAKKEILDAIKDIVMVVDSDKGLPKVKDNPISIELKPGLMKKYKQLEDDFFTVLDDGTTLEALNQASQSQKLRQFLSGFVYDKETTTGVVRIHEERLKALKELMTSLHGHNLLIAIQYKEDVKMIQEYLKKDIPCINSDTKQTLSDTYIRDWNRGVIPVLLAHPASIGHGLNLQMGGNQIIWFSNTWSLEHYEQMIARLRRRGQLEGTVFNHIMSIRGTIDEALIGAVRQKDATQESILAYLLEWRKGR